MDNPQDKSLEQQALEWLANRRQLSQSRERLRQEPGMWLSDKPSAVSVASQPEPLRSEINRLLAARPELA